mmetsp:Transcript_50784/g.54947  ORF Transcript_50784/g.54947 Transcript_50784/m.54947 type:complete len:204 (-) Transcript_50784:1770-2381(-)
MIQWQMFSHTIATLLLVSNRIESHRLLVCGPRRQRHDCKGRRRRLPELLHEPPRLHRAHLQLRLREGGRIGVQHGTRRHHGHLGRCQHQGWLWSQTIGITVPDVYEACVFALREAGLLRVSEDAQRGRHEGTRLPQGPRRVFIWYKSSRRAQGSPSLSIVTALRPTGETGTRTTRKLEQNFYWVESSRVGKKTTPGSKPWRWA